VRRRFWLLRRKPKNLHYIRMNGTIVGGLIWQGFICAPGCRSCSD